MTSNEHSEKWAEICFLLSSNVRQSMNEKDFENQVVRALEVLGWSEFKGEIERQPVVQLGREGTLRPDLIVRGIDKKCLIVIEVKRPLENITRDHVIGQLRSYMRQMKSDFGFLIGGDLRLYYDGPTNPNSDPILLERMDFEKTSESGTAFAGTFNKHSLSEGGHLEYLNKRLHQFSKTKEVSRLIEQMTSYETRQKVIGYLRSEFSDIGDDTFSEALRQVSIEIAKKDMTEKQVAAVAQGRTPQNRKVGSDQFPGRVRQTRASAIPDDITDASRIPNLQFIDHRQTRLRHIYGVLYFMKHGYDFPSATNQTLKLFPEVQDYQTISDKCARGFAGSVDAFISWFHSGVMLEKLTSKFSLSEHDTEIFRQLLL